MKNKFTQMLTIEIIALLLIIHPVCFAQKNDIPGKLQVAIFSKVFSFDRAFKGKNNTTILISFAGTPGKLENELVSEFNNSGFKAELVENGNLNTKISDKSIVLITSGITVSDDVLNSNGALSFSYDESLVEKGRASVGLTLESGKPILMVNAKKLKKEGRDLPSELLKISKIF